MKNAFKFPMKKSERVIGCIYIPVHAVFLPLLLGIIFIRFWPEVSAPYQTLIYYTISFVLVVAFMFRYLRQSFSDFIEGFWRALQAAVLGYALYYVLLIAAGYLLTQVMSEINPNSELFIEEARINYNVMIAVSAVLAPIVEETIFRGALFGTIRQKSRIAAYIVSILVFALYHLWQFVLVDSNWSVLLYAIQYLPASIALAWCYERSGTIWSPIILHAGINLIATVGYK